MPWLVMPKTFRSLMTNGSLSPGFSGSGEVGQDERDLVAGLVVLRAANDGALALAVVDLADGELVRAGHVIVREDLGDDDAVEFAAGFVDALDFEAEHGEPLGQLLGRPVEINVLFEPVKGDFHFVMRKKIAFSCEPPEKSNGFNSLGESRVNLRPGIESNLNFKCLTLFTIFA